MVDFENVLRFAGDRESGIEYKNSLIKKNIVSYLAMVNEAAISDLSRELNISVPTSTKLILELKDEGYLSGFGKIETAGGRRPNIFGLTPDAYYFLGVDVRRRYLEFVLLNFRGEIVSTKHNVPFILENTQESLECVCREIGYFIDEQDVTIDKMIGMGISITGRVDSNTGCTYSYFNFYQDPLADVLTKRFNIPVYIENDSRAMMYAEKVLGVVKDAKNVVFLNLGRGIGIGMMFDGKLYYGKSGYAGEFGHIPIFENDIICYCGKKGCLETEASGIVLEKKFVERMKAGETSILSEKWNGGEDIFLRDIIEAANHDDVLSISLIYDTASKLGRGVGMLLNLFNPELVVIGGSFSLAGDYLMLPLQTAINKYSLSLVNKDTAFKISNLGDDAAVLGVALLVRAKILGIL